KVLVGGSELSDLEVKTFNSIWKSPAPSKIIAFSWQLLHDRVSTKQNLFLRGVIHHANEVNCGWCLDSSESAIHLFLHCRVAMEVWYEIFK
ncbi:F-box family protein, partial [Trifolium medium]|nr:F-box family protein [Trifolium medium]